MFGVRDPTAEAESAGTKLKRTDKRTTAVFPVSMEMGAETCLLCQDEFQVRRVAG